jgi:hypothetical protein
MLKLHSKACIIWGGLSGDMIELVEIGPTALKLQRNTKANHFVILEKPFSP